MAFSKVKRLTTLLTASLLVGGIGCGDAGSNNDQGTSVTAVGYCGDVDCNTGQTGAIVPLSTDVSNINSGVFALDGQTVITFMRIQNRLISQFVRIDRIDCDYEVPGADVGLKIPSDSFGSGAVIEATPGAAPGVANSESVVGFEIVSPDLFAYLNANRLKLPELPFRATAICRAVVVTQAGDTLTTNALNFFLQFGEVSECCTGNLAEVPTTTSGGFQQGNGAGGTLNTFGGATVTGAAAEEPATGEAATGDDTTVP